MILKYIGVSVAKRRRELNITQSELSEAVGISIRSLRDIERGHDFKMSYFLSVCDALTIEPCYLIHPQSGHKLDLLSNKEKDQILENIKTSFSLIAKI